MAGQRIDIKILTNVQASLTSIKKLQSALDVMESSVKQVEGTFKKTNSSVQAANRGFDKATKSLKLTNSAFKNTAKDLALVNTKFKTVGATSKTAFKSTAKDITLVNTKLKQVGTTAKTSFSKVSREAKKAKGSLDNFKAGLAAGLGFGAVDVALRSITALAGAFRRGVTDAKNFEQQVAEINTLLPSTSRITEEVTGEFFKFSTQFGKDVTEQTRAFYDIVSAGIKGTSKQLDVLNQSNQAAVAGLTNVQVAADILTSALNAYSLSGLTAQEASDSLFAAVREGKTRFDELASTVGRVAPIAASAGISFEDLTGTVAFLTKTGISTDIAVTSLRQAIATLLKPTEQTTQAAARLGIEFDANALKTKGLAGVFRDIREATQGNNSELNQLFPNIRALTAAIAISTGDFEDFERVLDTTNNSIGDTSRAFRVIADTDSNKIDRALQVIKNSFQSLGQSALPIIGSIAQAFINWNNATSGVLENAGRFKTLDGQLEVVNERIETLTIATEDLNKKQEEGRLGFLDRKTLSYFKDQLTALKKQRAEIEGSEEFLKRRASLSRIVAGEEEAFLDAIKKSNRGLEGTVESVVAVKESLSEVAKLSDTQLKAALNKIKDVGKTQVEVLKEANLRNIAAVEETLKRKIISETKATSKIKALNIKLSEDIKNVENKKVDDIRKAAKRREEIEKEALDRIREAAANPIKTIFESGIDGNELGIGAGIANSIAQGAEGAKKIVTEAASVFLDTIIPGLGQALEPLIDAFSQGPEATRQFVREFAQAIPELVKNIVLAAPAFIQELIVQLPKLAEALAESTDEMVLALTKAAPSIGVNLATAMAVELPLALVRSSDDIAEAFSIGIAEGFIRGARDSIREASNEFERGLSTSKDLFDKIFTDSFKDAVSKGFNKALDGMKEAFKKVMGSSVVEGLKEGFSKVGSEIKGFLKKFGKGITAALVGGISGVTSGVFLKIFEAPLRILKDQLKDVIKEFVEFGKEGFKELIGSFLDSGIVKILTNIVESVIEDVGKFLDNLASKLTSFFTSLIKGLVSGVSNLVEDAILQPIKKVIDLLKDIGTPILSSIKTVLKDIGTEFYKLGGQILNGLKDGLGGLATGFVKLAEGFVTALGEKIVGAFKSLGDNFGSAIINGVKEALKDVIFGNILSKLFKGDKKKGGPVEEFIGLNFPFVTFAQGGLVGGNAKASGDSPMNDIIPALLSPGEIVLPRTAVNGGAQGIVEFLQSLGLPGFAEGGQVGNRSVFSDLFEDLGVDKISDFFGGLGSSLISEASGALNSFGVGGILDLIKDPVSFIKNSASLVQDNISKASGKLGIDAISDIIGAIQNFGLPEDLVKIIESLQKVVGRVNIAKDLKDIIKDPKEYVKGKVGSVATTLFKPNLLQLLNPTKLQTGGVIPNGFANDSFPALLSSNERVVPASTNNDLTEFLAEGNDVTNALLAQVVEILGTPQMLESNLELDGEVLASAILNLNRSNARFS